jgi:protocatechuate 3,4-dioxygenase beta subunit
MKSICATLLIAAMLLTARPLTPHEHLGTLEGTVLRADGKPLEGARVTTEQAEGAHPHATLTNSDGRFFFPRLSPGLYNLRAYYKGTWSEWERNAEVKVGKGTDVTLRITVSRTK